MQREQQLKTVLTPSTEPLGELNNYLKTSHQTEKHEETSGHQNNRLRNMRQKDEESTDEEEDEHLQKYWHHSPDLDRAYGPHYVWKTDKWLMGDMEIKFAPKNILINDSKYKATCGLYTIILYVSSRLYTK
ncbi:uncharacterized protein LOC126882442 [Diabrotica virgifera virgifera]|uniref:DUF8207 domain-containing protein n=1 Tax=Diabrotica virgifera virgifera TaxID=50390 RepID=A0ABM5JZJ8_DIAVI|nr:uncharacterized protein LOC126882442 [Diabrotica virgifera virgifera]XP_050503363.1 uncharacterized protein LOC126882442 [Diabrotica virgifera virgifera]